MPRTKGSRNRNYPPLGLSEALRVATALQDQASGMAVSRLTLAEILDVSPSSSNFQELVASSRFYGLTNGGINAQEFSLTPLGEKATGADEVQRVAALKSAVLTVPPYQKFFESFKGKKVPGKAAFREFLTRDANVPEERVNECMEFISADSATAGLLRSMKGSDYVDLEGVPPPREEAEEGTGEDSEPEPDGEPEAAEPSSPPSDVSSLPEPPSKQKKVFIAHGKNRTPLDQLKKALDQFKVKYAVAVDEPNKGRPISKKVATLMSEECSSGIFIFTADERFLKEMGDGTEEVWRPSENVIYELGAASILYENRIVIFKEKGVSFPTDFSDLGYIEFEKDQLVAELGSLFAELVGLDILEVRAKG